MMSARQKAFARGEPWRACASGLSLRTARVIGPRNPAQLHLAAENALILVTRFEPPGTQWLALLVTLPIVAFVVAMKGPSPAVMGAAAGGTIAVTYTLLRLWRGREIKLDLAQTATSAILDEKRRRIAFLAPVDQKARWIVLEFEDDFSEASGAVEQIMGAKCQAGKIARVDMVFVVVILAIVVCFFVAFGYFVVKGTLLVPTAK